MLQVERIEIAYGAATAIRDVSFTVPPGQVTALLGANGAGKTTIMLGLSGLLPVKAGRILFDGVPLETRDSEQRLKLGIAQVPQGRQVFPEMTVMENLELGAFVRRDAEITTDLARILDLFPRLAERAGQFAGTLSGGEQQMLAIGRALMARPKLLLLDEPSLGLAPLVVDMVYEVIGRLATEGLSILLAEQNVTKALSVATQGFVLDHGAVIAGGPAQGLATTDFVRKAYLG